MQPNEIEKFSIPFLYEDWKKLDEVSLYFANRVSYFLDDELTKEAQIGKIFLIRRAEVITFESWIKPR